MANEPTIKDPYDIPVQINFHLPFGLREMLRDMAHEQHTSVNALLKRDVMDKYGREYTKRCTERAGATK